MESWEQFEIKSSLEKRKSKVKDILKQIKALNLEELDQLEKLDNTNSELLKSKIRLNKKNKELLYKSYDTLSKEELNELKIKKELSNRQAYFSFLNYVRKVEIINQKEKEEIKEIKETSRNETFVPQIVIDFSSGEMKFTRAKEEPNQTGIEEEQNIEEEKKEEFFKKKKVNIKNYFNHKEKITLKDLRTKLSNYRDILTFYDFNRNNFPDFQSELYFHHQLKNVILTFLELNDEEFLEKKHLISSLDKIIKRVKKNKIKDSEILTYFYLVMDIEIELGEAMKLVLNNYKEKEFSFKNCEYNPEKNQLIIDKDSNLIINNIDLYDLDEADIDELRQRIKKGKKLNLNESSYSLKGLLTLREFSKKEGNMIYEKFLPSNLLKDIIHYLYGFDENIFGMSNVMKTFKENTYYFPIKNSGYCAYTDKDLFKIFIDYKLGEDIQSLKFKKKKFKKYIKKAIMIISMEHEFGHCHRAFLFFYDSKNNFYDSPKAKIILPGEEIINIDEGGELFEYLLYGRKIESLNLKEVIYIINLDNFSKNLKKFRDDFINLNNETLNTIFEREGKKNDEIKEIFQIYNNLSNKEQQQLENLQFKLGKINKNTFLDFENMVFYRSSTGNIHNKNKRIKNKK